jgi:hypothetical protein
MTVTRSLSLPRLGDTQIAAGASATYGAKSPGGVSRNSPSRIDERLLGSRMEATLVDAQTVS